ncbi:MAG: hypothetical protein WBI14_00170 [Anaerolineaceae bacterium]
MTRLTKISQADLENVNTYLDGALSPKEKVAFEIQLANSLPLQSTLREYTILRNAIRSLPPKKAPHHFTLTAAEAKETRGNRLAFLAPAFSFASLVAVMLLAIVFTSDWIFKNMSAPAAPTAPAATEAPMVAVMSEPADQANESEGSSEVPLIFNWGSGGYGAYGLGGGSEMAKGGGTGSGMGISFDSRVINPAVANEEPLMSAEPVGEPQTPTAEPLVDATPAPLTAAKVPADYSGAIIWGLQPDFEGQIIEVYPTVTDSVQPETDTTQHKTESTAQEAAQPAEAPYQTAAWIKYTLAGLTLLFGLLAFFFQRRFS